MSIQNLSKRDPFAEDFDDEDTQQLSKAANDFSQKREASDVVHIRVRNGRKTLTTIQGLPEAFDPKKVLKAAKKEFACNGSMVEDEIYGQVIQLQGDQRQKISALLLEEGLDKQKLKVHGF